MLSALPTKCCGACPIAEFSRQVLLSTIACMKHSCLEHIIASFQAGMRLGALPSCSRLEVVLSLRAAVQVVGVDDEQPVRYSAKSLLNTEGYQVV